MDDRVLIENIIESIKQYTVLYDKTVSSRSDTRESIWQEIADKYDIDVHVLKAKWKNLRDCYKKHIRAQSEDTKAVSSYKYWQWSKFLDFLKPHIRHSNKELINCDESDDNASTDDVNFEELTEFTTECEPTKCLDKQPKKRRIHSGTNASNLNMEFTYAKKQKIINTNAKHEANYNYRAEINEFDGIELIFLGYAKTVKNMPLKRQISVKMKIAKIMMEEELKCIE